MKNLNELLLEDTPLQPAAETSRQPWYFLASVLIGVTICVPVFVMGAQLSQQLPYPNFVFAALAGGVLATIIACATGIVGQRSGLPTAMLAKIAFGSKGYILANLAMAITAIGWFGIQTSVFGNAFVSLSGQVWGITMNPVVVMVISGLVMSTTAIIGFRGLGKLSYLAVPLLVVLLLLPLYIFYQDGKLVGVTGFAPKETTLAFGTMVAIVAGAYSFACTMPDVTRFMRSTRATIGGMIANFTLAYPLLLILTGTAAIASGNGDYMQIMINLGFGSLAIVVLFLATWTTNDTNVYSGALSANLFLPKIKRWKIAAAVGILGTLFAVLGIFEHFMSWLIFTGNLFAPMAGVYVADYWLNKDRYAKLDSIPSFRVPQICSWLIGLGVGICTTGADNMGLELFSLTTIPMLDALLCAAVIQLVLHKIVK